MNLSQLFGLDYRSLAVFRIALALVIIGDVVDRSHDLGAHYTDEGGALSVDLSHGLQALYLEHSRPITRTVFGAMHVALCALMALGSTFTWPWAVMRALRFYLLFIS